VVKRRKLAMILAFALPLALPALAQRATILDNVIADCRTL
jgi:hypothetical protein